MLTLSSTHAIGYAHFKIVGGMKSSLIVAGAYLSILGGMIALSSFVFSSSGSFRFTAGVLDYWPPLLLGLQVMLLVLFGGFRVSGCIRSDLNSRMIESHRLMPVSSWRAVFGYMVGANGQLLVVAAANFLLGFVVAATAPSVRLSDYFLGHIVVVFFALMVWSLAAALTFVMRYAAFFVVGFLVLGVCTYAMFALYVFVPGVALLCTPLLGESIFSMTGGMADLRWAYPVGMLFQVLFFALFFVGACRRYRGTYATTFNVLQAMLVLLCWTVVSAIGIVGWNDVRLSWISWFSSERIAALQLVSTLGLSMVVAMLPMFTALASREKVRSLVLQTVAVLLGVWICLCVLLIGSWAVEREVGVGAGGPTSTWTAVAPSTMTESGPTIPQVLTTMGVLGAHVVTLFAVLWMMMNRTAALTILLSLLVLLGLWGVPLLLEFFRWMLNGSVPDDQFSILGTLSPLGLLISTWLLREPPTGLVGLGVQVLIGALTMFGAIGLHQRRMQKMIAVAAVPAVVTPGGVKAPPVVAAGESGEATGR